MSFTRYVVTLVITISYIENQVLTTSGAVLHLSVVISSAPFYVNLVLMGFKRVIAVTRKILPSSAHHLFVTVK